MALPAVASLAIFQFRVWNDFLIALVFAAPDSAPLTMAIRDQTRQFGSNIDVISVGAFLSMIVRSSSSLPSGDTSSKGYSPAR